MKSVGFSLLELIIAGAISAFVTSGLIMSYVGIKGSYIQQNALLEMQDSGRFAVSILNERLRIAGWIGCVDPDNPVHQNQAVTGYDSDHLPDFLKNQVVPDTDVVVVYSCVANSHLSEDTKLLTLAYYIGDTGRKNAEGQPVLALFQKPSDGDRVELASGVERMKIMYGVNIAANLPLQYFSVAQISNWEQVRGIQIDLLINSIDAVLKKPLGYYYQNQFIVPNDKMLHRAWNTYIDLRERV